ncbi:MAG TPA: hypothetical protein VGA56_12880, partial [Opitutaceae bacterium]
MRMNFSLVEPLFTLSFVLVVLMAPVQTGPYGVSCALDGSPEPPAHAVKFRSGRNYFKTKLVEIASGGSMHRWNYSCQRLP